MRRKLAAQAWTACDIVAVTIDMIGASMRTARLPVLLLVAFLLGVPGTHAQEGTAHGTAIAGILTKSVGVIAADSKLELVGSWKPEQKPSCKIKVIGEIGFAIAKLYRVGPTGFDAWAIAEKAVASSHTPQEAADKFVPLVGPELAKAAAFIHSDDPLYYDQRYKAPGSIREIIFMGYDGNKHPVASVRAFHAPNGVLQGWATGADMKLGDERIVALGENIANESAAQHAFDPKSKKVIENPRSLARKLVQLEIDATPSTVGPPIVEVQFADGGNITWPNPCR